MDISDRIVKFSETAAPRSSMLLVMGLTAFAFDPKMQSLDMTAPVNLFLLRAGKTAPGRPRELEWCAVFYKKDGSGGKSPLKFELEGLCTKDFGDRVAVTHSKQALDAITELPKAEKIGDDEDCDVSATIYPAKILQEYQDIFAALKREYFAGGFNPASQAGSLPRLKALMVELNYVEKALPQISAITLKIRIRPEELRTDITVTAEKGSAFEKFTDAQTSDGGDVQVPQDADISGGGLIKLTPDLAKSISSMMREIAIENAAGEEDLSYTDAVSRILEAGGGKFYFWADEKNPVSLFKIMCPESAVTAAVTDLRKAGCGKAAGDSMTELAEFKSGGKISGRLFLRSCADGAALIAGDNELNAAAAVQAITAKKLKAETLDAGGFMALARTPGVSKPAKLNCSITHGKIKLSARAPAEMFKGIFPGGAKQPAAPAGGDAPAY
jgi:hypothetical protein